MKANIFTITDGLIIYEDLKLVRIKSKEYNLLIMRDYMPIIGEIDGTITFEGVNITQTYENIKGFYMSKENEFNLIIRKIKKDD